MRAERKTVMLNLTLLMPDPFLFCYLVVRVEADLDHVVDGALTPLGVPPRLVEQLQGVVWVSAVPLEQAAAEVQTGLQSLIAYKFDQKEFLRHSIHWTTSDKSIDSRLLKLHI